MKKKVKAKKTETGLPKQKKTLDFSVVKLPVLAILILIFLFSVFRHIAYPLFWADEGMTVVGAQRVMEFGFPKVHDGKNVFYDLRHDNPELGIDPETDAYIGGAGWGQYYFGTIGVAIAQNFSDNYTKTAIIRSSFAIVGILALFSFLFLLTGLFEKRSAKLNFAIGFVAVIMLSVSLVLHIREARYYSLALFCILLLNGIYISHRFLKKHSPYIVAGLFALLLSMLFMIFAPAFFIMMVVFGVSEFVIIIAALIKKQTVMEIFISAKGIAIGMTVALIAVIPLIIYFKTFEISSAMAEYNKFNFNVYSKNLEVILRYFYKFELLWLFLAFKILMLAGWFKVDKKSAIFKASLFLTFMAIVFAVLIARVPNFIYTRYIVYLQPVLAAVILLDFFIITQSYPSKFSINKLVPTGVFVLFLIFHINTNSENLSGRIAELKEPYKGPLDYTIPFIQEKYENTDTLVIAANYEETSYMYYLNSKVIVGFVGNNLKEDATADPDIVCYRKSWGRLADVFNGFFKKSRYLTQTFEVYDSPVNNIPELNFMPAFNHKFKTEIARSGDKAAKVYFKPAPK